MLSAIVGINWGDEAKGRMVDLLSQDYDVVRPLSGPTTNAPVTLLSTIWASLSSTRDAESGILRRRLSM